MGKEFDNSIWTQKGATLSHKNAMKEYNLKVEELEEALKSGALHYRINYVHGNPYYKLIRNEIELYIKEKNGGNHLLQTKLKFKFDEIGRAIKKHKREIKKLEKEQKEIHLKLEEMN